MDSLGILTPDHGYVLLSIIALAFQPTIFGIAVGRVRGQVLSKEFMDGNFQAEHERATGGTVSRAGYPDMGEGRYSAKLSYSGWYIFNNAQRAHYHLLEGYIMTVIYVAFAGLFHPTWAALAGFIIFLGKFGDLSYISNEGARHIGRRIGGTISLLGNLVAFILSFVSILSLIKSE